MPDPALIREVSDASIFGDLVFFTGAGVSLELRQQADPARRLPSWHRLLVELTVHLGARLPPAALEDLKALLLLDDTLSPTGGAQPTGDMLIQAAEVLDAVEDVRPHVARLTASVHGVPAQGHVDMERLTPRGYVTFNYDKGHEFVGKRTLAVVRSDDTAKLVELVKGGFESPFVVKAHGCVDAPSSIVLSARSYKEILYRSEAYRALMTHVFNRFLVVSVGFGLADPDFDALLGEFERTFGTVPRAPIVVTREPADALEHGRRVAMRRRFGVRFLSVARFEDLPALFQAVESSPGERVQALIERCISPSRQDRHAAHKTLERLSDHGRAVFKRWIFDRLHELQARPPDRRTVFTLAELLYTVKILGALTRAEADAVRAIVDGHPHYEPPALGLLALQAYYPADADWPAYEHWLSTLDARMDTLRRMPESLGFVNYPERHRSYLGTLRTYVQVKRAKDAADLGP